MDIQFFHNRILGFQNKPRPRGGSTVALEVPPKSALVELFDAENAYITLGCGEVTCHPKENYCKEIGRRLSAGRMQSLVFRLVKIEIYKHQRFYHLYNPAQRIVLVTSTKSKTVRFTGRD